MRGRNTAIWSMALLALFGLAACGSERSVQNYCDTFFTEGAKFRDAAFDAQRSDDPLATAGMLASAPDKLAELFDKLDEVAPEDIEPDVATVAESFHTAAEAKLSGADGGSLLADTANGLINGLTSYPSLQRVDEYTTEHCGPPPSN